MIMKMDYISIFLATNSWQEVWKMIYSNFSLLGHQRRNECQTVGGPDQGRPCMFPFKFQGKIYNECPVAHLEDPSKTWCSTMGGNHVTGQKKWGYCSSSCPVSNEKEASFSGNYYWWYFAS